LTLQPRLSLLDAELVETIIEEAHGLLKRHGVETPNQAALGLAADHGLRVGTDSCRIHIDADTIGVCLASAPNRVDLFSRSGHLAMALVDGRSHFNPGSAAIAILDPGATRSRAPGIADCVQLARLVDGLPNLAGQSTSLVPGEVPAGCEDWIRLLIALLYSDKPVITGTFGRGSMAIMRDLLLAVRGSDRALREQPLAIFDCCPSPPLKWGDHIAQDLIDAARWGIPVELVSMPALGSVAPVTLVGALIQHTAESLSGVVLSQLACPGAPVVYGGSPSLFDMRRQTTPMGAIESMMMMCGHAQIGRRLGLPTHAYLGLSDSKTVDAQSGAEASCGAVLGVLAGVNNMSGAGMLELESCLSLEKLAIDDDICGMALRLADGIAPAEGDLPSAPIFEELLSEGHLLRSQHTLDHYRDHFYPSVFDRAHRDDWLREGARETHDRAAGRVAELLAGPRNLPEPDVARELLAVHRTAAPGHSLPALPGIDED
jgi:trimethylamine--corrinoid protein Co-methyltransferase